MQTWDNYAEDCKDFFPNHTTSKQSASEIKTAIRRLNVILLSNDSFSNTT